MSGTQFESHAGSASAKKWKTSLRVEPGSCPEVPQGVAAFCNLRHAGCKVLSCSCACEAKLHYALHPLRHNRVHSAHVSQPVWAQGLRVDTCAAGAGRAAITIGKWMDMMGLDRPVRAPRPANSDEGCGEDDWGVTTRRAKRQGAAGGRQVIDHVCGGSEHLVRAPVAGQAPEDHVSRAGPQLVHKHHVYLCRLHKA